MAQFLRLVDGSGINLDQVMWWETLERGVRLTFNGSEADEHGYLVPIT